MEDKTKRKQYTKFCDKEDLAKAKPEYAVFAQNLSELITAKGVSPEALASALGLSSATSISMYRNGQQFPRNPVQLIKLADALGTTVDALIGNADNETYVQEDDLMVYSELFGLSPVAIANMHRVSYGVDSASRGMDALLSHKDMKNLMRSVQDVLSKVDYIQRQMADRPTAPDNYKDSLMELVHGKLYVAARTFEAIIEDMVNAELNKPIVAAKEVTNAEEE